jgi:hypothetical protein
MVLVLVQRAVLVTPLYPLILRPVLNTWLLVEVGVVDLILTGLAVAVVLEGY